MPAQIRWDSGAGEETLEVVGDSGQFNGWRVQPNAVGERAVAVGDGLTYVWRHRTDYGVSFHFNVAEADQDDLQGFIEWANAGGLFAIDTDDSESNTYDECCIAPGTLIEAGDHDPVTLDIPVTASVINAASSPVVMRRIID
jgi:hypothetical protein